MVIAWKIFFLNFGGTWPPPPSTFEEQPTKRECMCVFVCIMSFQHGVNVSRQCKCSMYHITAFNTRMLCFCLGCWVVCLWAELLTRSCRWIFGMCRRWDKKQSRSGNVMDFLSFSVTLQEGSLLQIVIYSSLEFTCCEKFCHVNSQRFTFADWSKLEWLWKTGPVRQNLSVCDVLYTVSGKKRVWGISGITSSNTGRFLTFFHCYNLQKIYNKAIVKYPTTPQTRHYTTLGPFFISNRLLLTG